MSGHEPERMAELDNVVDRVQAWLVDSDSD